MRQKSASLWPVYAIAFLNFTGMAILFPVMPHFAAGLGATVTEVGIIVALQLYVAALTQTPVGMLSDLMGRRRLLAIGILIFILSYLAYPFVTNLGALIVLRAVNGLGNAGFYPAASALVVDLAPPEKRGEALGLFATGTQLGNMAGPAMGGFLLQYFDYNTAFYASAFIAFLALLITLFCLKGAGGGVFASGKEKLTIKWLWNREAIISLIATNLIMVGIAGVISFLPLYGKEIQISMARVGLIISTVYIGSVLTRYLAGRLSDKLGRMPLILAGMTLSTMGILLFFFVTAPLSFHGAALIFGVGLGTALPACSALIADQAPPGMRGFAMGLNSAFFNGGTAIGATALGIIADNAGFPAMYLATALIMGVSVLIMYLATRKNRAF